jgi:hypothetical protein
MFLRTFGSRRPPTAHFLAFLPHLRVHICHSVNMLHYISSSVLQQLGQLLLVEAVVEDPSLPVVAGVSKYPPSVSIGR